MVGFQKVHLYCVMNDEDHETGMEDMFLLNHHDYILVFVPSILGDPYVWLLLLSLLLLL